MRQPLLKTFRRQAAAEQPAPPPPPPSALPSALPSPRSTRAAGGPPPQAGRGFKDTVLSWLSSWPRWPVRLICCGVLLFFAATASFRGNTGSATHNFVMAVLVLLAPR